MRLDDVMLQEVTPVFLKMAIISMIALLVLLLLLGMLFSTLFFGLTTYF